MTSEFDGAKMYIDVAPYSLITRHVDQMSKRKDKYKQKKKNKIAA